jgi:hypothetical protein
VIALLLAALTIAAEPPRVQLGETARARLRIEARSEPRLSASVGRIEDLRSDGDGRWIADYVPPDDSVPQLALISAAAGGEAALFSLPLWGQGDAVVKTRPRARIEVRIGEERYPATADDTGTAVVPVNVPPGVTAAKHGAQSIDLHVPPLRLVHVALDRDQARADRTEKVSVLLFAVTGEGSPRPQARFSLRATRGEVSQPRPAAPGVYEATWTFSPGSVGRATLSAALAEAPTLVAAASIDLRPGPSVSLKLSADRERFVAGEGPFTVRATALDAAGNPATEPLHFDASLGQVRVTGNEATVEVPASFAGLSDVRVTARPATRNEPIAQVVLPLVPGDPDAARIDLPASRLRADGKSSYPVRVRLLDRFGNAIADARPEITADAGALSSPARAEGGAYVATYLAPAAPERTVGTIEVRAGSAGARRSFDLVPRIHALAVAPRAGFLANFSGFTAPVVAVESSLRTSHWGPELAFSLDLSYAFRNAAGSSSQGITARGHTDWIAAALGASYRFGLSRSATAWVGGGPQLAAVLTRTELGGLPPETGTALVPGAWIAAGAERRLGSHLPFAELRASICADPDLPNLRGALRALALTVGYRFEAL